MVMDPDEKVAIFNKGFKAGEEHSHPSQETRDFMMQTKETFEEIKKKISDLPTKEGVELSNEKLLRKLLDEVKSEFVSKEEFKPVRLFVYGIMSFIGLYVIKSLLELL